MSVRINLEFGHEAVIRNQTTTEGYTHDWKIFVRGCNNAPIHSYIEKVVFYLHKSFSNSKRVVTKPPYMVKESGYAGFTVLIDIYIKKNRNPNKIQFKYELVLQASGPPIFKIQKDKYIFKDPSPELQEKLLEGGGMILSEFENTSPNEKIKSTRKSRKRSTQEQESTDDEYINVEDDCEMKKLLNSKKTRVEEDYPKENTLQPKLNREMLVDLYNKIMYTQDSEKLRQIISMMSKSGYLEETNSDFEFDLCVLDSTTLKNLQKLF